MGILVLNGSPHPNGNTAALIEAFSKGAAENGNDVTVFDICDKKIAGCRGCEYCHTKGNGRCIQDDDMQQLYPLLERAEMLVFASPIYYFGLTGQMQCALHRTYAIGTPKNLRKTAMLLSSGADGVYEGAVFEYEQTVGYYGVEDVGICKAFGSENGSEEKLAEAYRLGKSIR